MTGFNGLASTGDLLFLLGDEEYSNLVRKYNYEIAEATDDVFNYHKNVIGFKWRGKSKAARYFLRSAGHRSYIRSDRR